MGRTNGGGVRALLFGSGASWKVGIEGTGQIREKSPGGKQVRHFSMPGAGHDGIAVVRRGVLIREELYYRQRPDCTQRPCI